MNGKGDKWRGGWTLKYSDNFNKIFREDKMNQTTPEMYLEMWLSEQIPINEWKRLLEFRPDIKELYEQHLKEKK